MFAAALFTTVLGFSHARPVPSDEPGGQAFAVTTRMGRDVVIQAGRVQYVRESEKPRVLTIEPDPAPSSQAFSPAVPVLSLKNRRVSLDESGALSLNSMAEALALMGRVPSGSVVDGDALLCLLVTDEEIDHPVTKQASSKRLVDGVLSYVAAGI